MGWLRASPSPSWTMPGTDPYRPTSRGPTRRAVRVGSSCRKAGGTVWEEGEDGGIHLQGVQRTPAGHRGGGRPAAAGPVRRAGLPGADRRCHPTDRPCRLAAADRGAGRPASGVDLGGGPGAAPLDLRRRHPLRHQVEQAGHQLRRGVGRHPARPGRAAAGGDPCDRLQLRRLHHQPAAGGPARRQGVGCLGARGQAAAAGAWRAGQAAGAPPVLLEERQVAERAAAARPRPGRLLGVTWLPSVRRPMEGAEVLGRLSAPKGVRSIWPAGTLRPAIEQVFRGWREDSGRWPPNQGLTSGGGLSFGARSWIQTASRSPPTARKWKSSTTSETTTWASSSRATRTSPLDGNQAPLAQGSSMPLLTLPRALSTESRCCPSTASLGGRTKFARSSTPLRKWVAGCSLCGMSWTPQTIAPRATPSCVCMSWLRVPSVKPVEPRSATNWRLGIVPARGCTSQAPNDPSATLLTGAAWCRTRRSFLTRRRCVWWRGSPSLRLPGTGPTGASPRLLASPCGGTARSGRHFSPPAWSASASTTAP